MILVKQPVPRLLPHVDYELLETEALVVNDRGRGVIQRLRVTLVPSYLALPVMPFTCNEQNMSLFGYETQPIFHSPACW